MRVLVTGGCGFIGSNFIYKCLEKYPSTKIINIDKMTFGSNIQNFKNFKNKNYEFVKGDICDKNKMEKLIKKVDYVINFAAESHVDRSISNSDNFVKSNIIGVHNILEIIRKYKKIKLIQISTDEVYGESLHHNCKETEMLKPSNPYAATKASAEMLINAYNRTYGLESVITRCTNNFGPRQFPEKLIPKTIISALKNERIPIHGKGESKRQWIHVNDHCDALLKIISKWPKNQIYNISGTFEISNLKLVNMILKYMKKSNKLINFVEDRPGQDRRYKINSNLIQKEFEYKPKMKGIQSIQSTVDWYLSNIGWWKNLPFDKIKNPTPWIKN
jgi:dTDP-glucose 4,6-dehydratase